MNLVDSSAWLEYLTDGKNAKHFAPVIEDTKNLVVSVINIYELYKKIYNEKGESTALQIIGLVQQGKVIDVTSDIAIKAARISNQFKLPLADSIIYTTAIENNSLLWTQDKDFEGLEGVKYFKKK